MTVQLDRSGRVDVSEEWRFDPDGGAFSHVERRVEGHEDARFGRPKVRAATASPSASASAHRSFDGTVVRVSGTAPIAQPLSVAVSMRNAATATLTPAGVTVNYVLPSRAWDAPVRSVNVRFVGAVAPTEVIQCVVDRDTDVACATRAVDGGVSASVDAVPAGTALRVSVLYPRAAVGGLPHALRRATTVRGERWRWWLWPGLLALCLALRVRHRGDVERAFDVTLPPDDLDPASLAVLRTGHVDGGVLLGTLLYAAERGHVRLERTEPDDAVLPRWRAVAAESDLMIPPAASRLVRGLTRGDGLIEPAQGMTERARRRLHVRAVRRDVHASLRGLSLGDPERRLRLWVGAGLSSLAGLVVVQVLGFPGAPQLVLGALVCGAALWISPLRTRRGRDVVGRTESFRRFLAGEASESQAQEADAVDFWALHAHAVALAVGDAWRDRQTSAPPTPLWLEGDVDDPVAAVGELGLLLDVG